MLTPSLAGLRLYDSGHDVEPTGRHQSADVTAGSDAAAVGRTTRIGVGAPLQRPVATASTHAVRQRPVFTHPDVATRPGSSSSSRPRTATPGAIRPTARRSLDAEREASRQDAGTEPSPPSTRTASLSRADSSPTGRPRSSDARRQTRPATAAFVSAAAGTAADGLATEPVAAGVTAVAGDEGQRSYLSQWKRDLRREAPPALYGSRRSAASCRHVVVPAAGRRRRLAALQARQTAARIGHAPAESRDPRAR